MPRQKNPLLPIAEAAQAAEAVVSSTTALARAVGNAVVPHVEESETINRDIPPSRKKQKKEHVHIPAYSTPLYGQPFIHAKTVHTDYSGFLTKVKHYAGTQETVNNNQKAITHYTLSTASRLELLNNTPLVSEDTNSRGRLGRSILVRTLNTKLLLNFKDQTPIRVCILCAHNNNGQFKTRDDVFDTETNDAGPSVLSTIYNQNTNTQTTVLPDTDFFASLNRDYAGNYTLLYDEVVQPYQSNNMTIYKDIALKIPANMSKVTFTSANNPKPENSLDNHYYIGFCAAPKQQTSNGPTELNPPDCSAIFLTKMTFEDYMQ
jgi:hypothetical protein